MNKAKKLREMFASNQLIRIVGAHDGLSAKLVEKNGFEGIWASGLEVSTSHAVPDANILTMTDYLRSASYMNDAVNIPVIVDVDTGYGNSNNVIHMVKKFEAAGIAGVSIEDKRFPKVNSFVPGRQELAPVHEFVGKIIAAKNAQQSKDFMVFARVEALIAGWSEEEALKRAYAYEKAGADGIFIHSKSKNPDEINSFVKKWEGKIPLIICPTTYPSITEQQMKDLGKIGMVIYANHGIRASIKAMDEILGFISKNGIVNVDDKITPMKEVFELQGMMKMKEDEQKYLITHEPIKAIIPAAGANPNQPSLQLLLKDIPLAMLDINGKSLLQRNVDTLKKVGVKDAIVIAGYQGDKINVDGVVKVQNDEYEKRHIMHSIMLAKDYLDTKTIIAFSDILFDEHLVEKLAKREDDIILVVDGSYKNTFNRNKKLDMVITKNPPSSGSRLLTSDVDNPIVKIAKSIHPNDAHYEFVGLAMFSEKGIKAFKEEYEKANVKYASSEFHEAPSFDMAGFTDMMQEMINNGHKVSTMVVNSGWSEIHNFDNYKMICEMLAEK